MVKFEKIHSVSLERFSGGKANLNKAKEKKTAAAHHKAKVLRKYAKLCKNEGLESDRVHIGNKVDKQEQQHVQKKPKFKPIPFAKEQEQARERAQQLLEEINDRNQRHKTIAEKQKLREQKRRQIKYGKKPRIGDQVGRLLEKIQKNVGSDV